MIVGHVMGIPVEETILQLASAGSDERGTVAGRSGDRALLQRHDGAAERTTKTSSRAGTPRRRSSTRPSGCSSTSGYAGITTRRLAEEAGVNHGLVHYYFGSNENLLVRALERFTERLIERQRELYAADVPFVEKWRTAMRYLVSEDVTLREDLARAAGARLEQRPELRERLARVHAEWRAVLTEAFARAAPTSSGSTMPLEALVSLVMHVQRRDHRRAPGGHRDRARRAAGLDRRMAVEPDHDPRGREQTRARYPDDEGYVERDGVRVFYEVYGDGEPTILLLPTWSIVHSRHWKAQIPYLARHCRVVTFDGRGNGRSDRPPEPAAYDEREFAADALAVHGRDRRPSAPCSSSALAAAAQRGAAARRRAPRAGRRRGLHRPGAAARRPAARRARASTRSTSALDTDEGWAKYNRHYWLRDYRGLPRVLLLADVHRAALDQADRGRVGWGLETDAETLVATQLAPAARRRGERARARCARVRCPVLVIHGDRRRDPPARRRARALAELTGGDARRARGLGPRARTPATRSRSTCCCATSSSAARRRRRAAWTRGAVAAASARSTSPRRSGSATRGATSRSPTSCASCTPTSRSTGWPSIR